MTKSKKYAVIDLKKIKSNSQLLALIEHILRELFPNNVDKQRSFLNKILKGKKTSKEVLEEYKEKLKGIKTRKNGVKALAFILSHSHEVEDKIERRRDDWDRVNLEWIEKRYGKENVLLYARHRDEKTTHAHVIILPLVKKMFRGKEATRMDADSVVGGREKLREMHNSYAEAMIPFGLDRGQEGSLAVKLSLPEMYTDKKEERDFLERKHLYEQNADLEKRLNVLRKNHRLSLELLEEKNLKAEYEKKKKDNKTKEVGKEK